MSTSTHIGETPSVPAVNINEPAGAKPPLRTKTLTPPRAAALAGIIFALLFSSTLIVIRLAVPEYQADAGNWVKDALRRSMIQTAIQLIPFAGIAFLWFIAVFRNHLGELEDQFFTTLFISSGILFVASVFVFAMLAGGLLETLNGQTGFLTTDAFVFVRQAVGAAMNIFAIKMAGVFIISASTIALRTAILPRWIAFSGYACAIVLLLVITYWPWIALVFPLWILAVSTCILAENVRRSPLPK
jgi:hypothetical protein